MRVETSDNGGLILPVALESNGLTELDKTRLKFFSRQPMTEGVGSKKTLVSRCGLKTAFVYSGVTTKFVSEWVGI